MREDLLCHELFRNAMAGAARKALLLLLFVIPSLAFTLQVPSRYIIRPTMPPAVPLTRLRGGGPPAPPAKPKKIRIAAFDSMRFFLIATIVMGHFISFANPSEFVFKLVSQHNVAVGAFFLLSGYVTAYTSTENGKLEVSSRLTSTPTPKWVLTRIFGYYPLHLVVLALFGPMFWFIDNYYNGPGTALWHGFLSTTLTQAWFPQHAEVWNAPTWYLSALSFITMLVPTALKQIAKLDKKQLEKMAMWLFAFIVLPKVGYWYDLKTLSIPEGVTSPKAHPNLAMFNMLRFSPLYNAPEVLLGMVACRLVMLDDEEKPIRTNALSTILPILGMVGTTVLRASSWSISDMFVRCLVWTPLFLQLLMSTHRNAVNGVKDPASQLLNSKLLVWLGNLSFPIFIVHGPVGQVFFKKLVATRLFGKVLKGPGYFGLYLATVAALAWILQQVVLKSKMVADLSKKSVEKLSSWA